jgi:hypothetical protein
MAATAEAFKLLAKYGEQPGATLIEFDGYASHSRSIARDPACGCGKRGA